MSKKGFTLIELLAVILILGIIALIAIPTVNNVITESKVGAWKATANNVVNAYEQYYQLCQMKGDTCVTDFDTTATPAGPGLTAATVKDKLSLKGDLPDEFTILKLTAEGDAMVTFTEDSITCTNISSTDSSLIVEMTCAKATN